LREKRGCTCGGITWIISGEIRLHGPLSKEKGKTLKKGISKKRDMKKGVAASLLEGEHFISV